jgi:glucokinase
MSHTLLADIGGSTSRFAYANSGGRPERIVAFSSDTVAGIDAAISHYLDGIDVRLDAAVLAVAGPIAGDEISLTNRTASGWRFRLGDLSQRFGLSPVHALNDFEALAWALPRLGPADVRQIGPSGGGEDVKVVLGPGTGLGVAGLVPTGNGWQVVPSEGGHSAFGPAVADEIPVFSRIMAECGGPVSAEMVLSGPGLMRMHRTLHTAAPPMSSERIVTQAQAGDPAARATTDLFVRLLGRFAGDVALMFKATGGVYLSGGVAAGLGPLLDPSIFRAAFEAHPPHQRWMASIPTALITCREPGLVGCAAVADHLLRESRAA